MILGYARVSTEDQKVDLQINALRAAGCDELITDHGLSGRHLDRPGLERALSKLKEGDTLLVWRLDRLGRSLIDLVQLVDELGKRGIHFTSLMENIDTKSSSGKLLFHMMAALAEFERSLISERTRAGMAAAKENGQHIGRPPGLTEEQVKDAGSAITNGRDVTEVAARYSVTVRSLRRMLKKSATLA
ncbi:recombinase family protein [Rhizobium sp. SG570]|uniref:recombinase family protein n=1 Tax=Rhizobium sp. SG570 TaxID=2587113 RepID=UPI0014481E79|nr:recombinase family protein [Rhizobium sp. SG570]NKJ40305.1 DNA invertase Pin-like site-specific DNA recombinase [Rhizobium sp. SG570]